MVGGLVHSLKPSDVVWMFYYMKYEYSPHLPSNLFHPIPRRPLTIAQFQILVALLLGEGRLDTEAVLRTIDDPAVQVRYKCNLILISSTPLGKTPLSTAQSVRDNETVIHTLAQSTHFHLTHSSLHTLLSQKNALSTFPQIMIPDVDRPRLLEAVHIAPVSPLDETASVHGWRHPALHLQRRLPLPKRWSQRQVKAQLREEGQWERASPSRP